MRPVLGALTNKYGGGYSVSRAKFISDLQSAGLYTNIDAMSRI